MEQNKYCINNNNKIFNFYFFSISDTSGEILAKEGTENSNTISDIVSSIWTDYNELGSQIFENEKLNYLIIENDDSNIVVTDLYGYIVAVKTNNLNNLGFIKLHLETIVKFLSDKLINFKQTIEERTKGTENK